MPCLNVGTVPEVKALAPRSRPALADHVTEILNDHVMIRFRLQVRTKDVGVAAFRAFEKHEKYEFNAET